jgi:hypothetical protein
MLDAETLGEPRLGLTHLREAACGFFGFLLFLVSFGFYSVLSRFFRFSHQFL